MSIELRRSDIRAIEGGWYEEGPGVPGPSLVSSG